MPSLRKLVPEPFVAIHAEAVEERDIRNREWVRVEAPDGKVRLKVHLAEHLGSGVVCVQHG